MPATRDVLLRETILKALAAFPGGADEATLAAAVERRLHPLVFPRGAEGALPPTLRAMEAEGLLARAGARLVPGPAPERLLPRWFDALGGVTHVAEGLHRSPLPYAPEHFAALRAAGIRVVYSFEAAVPRDLARDAGLDLRLHAWVDNGRPTFGEMDAFLADLAALPGGTRVVAHCKAGLGRTGMALACALAARDGWDAEAALARYWEKVPLARAVMESYGQAAFVRAYAASKRG